VAACRADFECQCQVEAEKNDQQSVFNLRLLVVSWLLQLLLGQQHLLEIGDLDTMLGTVRP